MEEGENLVIAFSSKNGFCPNFTYKNIKFYIQDRKRSSNDYGYSLYSKNIETKLLEFKTTEDVNNFLKSTCVKKCDRYSFGEVFEDRKNRYILSDKIIKVSEKEVRITADFDSFEECLKFSKEYVLDFITKQEPEQLQLIV